MNVIISLAKSKRKKQQQQPYVSQETVSGFILHAKKKLHCSQINNKNMEHNDGQIICNLFLHSMNFVVVFCVLNQPM